MNQKLLSQVSEQAYSKLQTNQGQNLSYFSVKPQQAIYVCVYVYIYMHTHANLLFLKSNIRCHCACALQAGHAQGAAAAPCPAPARPSAAAGSPGQCPVSTENGGNEGMQVFPFLTGERRRTIHAHTHVHSTQNRIPPCSVFSKTSFKAPCFWGTSRMDE